MGRRWPDGEQLEVALDRLLTKVDKPTRYLGGEWNAIVKDRNEVDVRMVLAFPDVYEIGMSHLGFRILYALLGRIETVAAERVFMPWIDMVAALREQGLPLTTLESRTPLADFDLVGFSMQYELTMTNVLAMLDLGGIPLEAAERGEGAPLVLGGGPVLVNPEPFADFFDLILVGEAEEALPEFLECYRQLRAGGATRLELIRGLARLEGWYAPSLYDLEAEEQLGMLIPTPREGEELPDRVRRRVLYDLDRFPFPAEIVVPHSDIVHDRVAWEIQRGCPVGCRFCQAGFIYRPTRERDPAAVIEGVRQSIDATGYDEFSLTSLNTGQYGAIEGLLGCLMDEMEPRQVAVGLSSLHASTMSEELVAQVKRVRKGGFTIAPEAGSQRLRNIINKNLSEEQILTATRRAFEGGWISIKLYFMIGLPMETDEDVKAQVELAAKILRQGREIGGRRVKLTLSASTFVPKVFTPFQWFGMHAEDDFLAKQREIRRAVPRGISFRGHGHGSSWLEGALSRADRRVGAVILEAYRRGALLDGWSEHFRLDLWRESFEHCGIDGDDLATRSIPRDARLPWEVIDPLVTKRWLRKEYDRALEAATVIPCGPTSCTACAPFAKECIKGVVAKNHWTSGDLLPTVPMASIPSAEALPEEGALAEEEILESVPPRPVYRYRAAFEKRGRARFLGHLDLVRSLLQGFRRAGLQVGYTAGFKPRPKVSFSPALGLGISSRAEYVDFETQIPLVAAEFLEHVNEKLSSGLRFLALVSLPPHPPALQESIRQADYEAELSGVAQTQLQAAVDAFEAQDEVVVVRVKKGKEKRLDIRPLVGGLRALSDNRLAFSIAMSSSGSAKPLEVLRALVGEETAADAALERVELLAEVDGRLVSPLLSGRVRHRA